MLSWGLALSVRRLFMVIVLEVVPSSIRKSVKSEIFKLVDYSYRRINDYTVPFMIMINNYH